LTIPEFLRRKKSSPKIMLEDSVSFSTKDISTWDTWDKIKQEKYGKRYDIVLGDEAPRIGNGFRIVYVREGRKWVYMTSHKGDPSVRSGKVVKRLSLKQWRDIEKRHDQYLKRNNPDEVNRKLNLRSRRKV